MNTIHRDGRVSLTSGARVIDPLHITHRQWRPRYESRPYRQHPGRRHHVHGPIQPMTTEPLLPAWAPWLALAVVAPFLASMIGGS